MGNKEESAFTKDIKTELSLMEVATDKYYSEKYGMGEYYAFKVMDDNLDDGTKKSICSGDIAIVRLDEAIDPFEVPGQCFMGKDRIIEGVGRMVARQFDI